MKTIWIITHTDGSTDGREIVQACTDCKQAIMLADRWANSYQEKGYVATITIDDMQHPKIGNTAKVVRLHSLKHPGTCDTATIEIYGIAEAE